MRWMRDLVAVVGVVTLAGGALYMQREKRQEQATVARAETDLRRMELEVKYRAATKSTDLNARGWPVTIDPAWFEGHAPDNPLVGEDRPWVEVAGTAQAELMHPPVRMAVDKSLAAYWYNPYQGLVRARVPVMVSDEQATTLYNRVNGTTMSSIFWRELPPPSAAPLSPAPSAPVAATPPSNTDETHAANGAEAPKVSLFSIFKPRPKKTSKSDR